MVLFPGSGVQSKKHQSMNETLHFTSQENSLGSWEKRKFNKDGNSIIFEESRSNFGKRKENQQALLKDSEILW